MEYLSVFSHSHFFIPEILKDLKKVIVLDDDVVVQRDLSFLWNIDMGDKVNGAVKFCGLRMGQLRNLLGKATYDPQSCAWMSGVNVIDLEKWREHNVTENYLQLLKKVSPLFKIQKHNSVLSNSVPWGHKFANYMGS
jgi:alpha-1,4-galacturonosyltransferase